MAGSNGAPRAQPLTNFFGSTKSSTPARKTKSASSSGLLPAQFYRAPDPPKPAKPGTSMSTAVKAPKMVAKPASSEKKRQEYVEQYPTKALMVLPTGKIVEQPNRPEPPSFKSEMELGNLVRRELTPQAEAAEVLKTLGKVNNPVTHSDVYSRTIHIVSCTTGHQMQNGPGGGSVPGWNKARAIKIKQQADERINDIFARVSVYFNGYTGEDLSNQQLKRLLEQGGGRWSFAFGKRHITHVVTATGLSGSKADKELNARKSSTYIVRPEWIVDSVAAGRRLPESMFGVLERDSQAKINTVFESRGPAKTSTLEFDRIKLDRERTRSLTPALPLATQTIVLDSDEDEPGMMPPSGQRQR
ncbi:uncharacterized protein L969DRAFT_84299 [Mixia osmundae IAM 14324]|uniref:BRCT domain-containing protein n=1 Tax=Mixia osmundae (strain CBS 9802 / IAM 14324 / JCM 22182 / KY 12970) TaxID=764103 RepID=G7E384_MIXOS|nr:uncharacterized protein L969DRAFT_84299 [Mixia osmundae IAM 14324]KEI42446.1 hypothetical protein L969DRAFT_84299 [Mixia osmundae IAM 14324]GAA97265.1 hypothetical protein E5Q_03942 [Mixia osmundae IAM 14324]